MHVWVNLQAWRLEKPDALLQQQLLIVHVRLDTTEVHVQEWQACDAHALKMLPTDSRLPILSDALKRNIQEGFPGIKLSWQELDREPFQNKHLVRPAAHAIGVQVAVDAIPDSIS